MLGTSDLPNIGDAFPSGVVSHGMKSSKVIRDKMSGARWDAQKWANASQR